MKSRKGIAWVAVLIVLAVTFLVGFIIFWYMHYWTARPHEEGRVLWRGFWSPDRESLDTPTMFPDVEVARYRLHAFRLHRDVGGTLEVRADGLHWKPGVWWAPGMERASGKVELPWSCQASLGLRHPLIVAQQWANLDVMSGGRMTFVACPGEATGPTRVRELAAFNMDHGEKLARMEE